MGVLLMLVIAIIIAKWLGYRRHYEQDSSIQWFLLALIFLAALLIPFFFWKGFLMNNASCLWGAQPFVAFLTSALLFVFFLSDWSDINTGEGAGSVNASVGPMPTFDFVAPADRDPLKKIEGIGPKIQQLLYDNGLYTFDHVAQTDHRHIKQILIDAGENYMHHNPETWPQQARLADQGKWEQLLSRQEELKGGRVV